MTEPDIDVGGDEDGEPGEPADALGNKFWPGENKVGGECLLVAVCKGG